MRRVPVCSFAFNRNPIGIRREICWNGRNVSRKTGQNGGRRKRSNKWIVLRYNRDRKCHLVRSSSFSRRALCSSFPVPEAIFNYRKTSARARKGKWHPRTILKLYFIPDKLRCFAQWYVNTFAVNFSPSTRSESLPPPLLAFSWMRLSCLLFALSHYLTTRLFQHRFNKSRTIWYFT